MLAEIRNALGCFLKASEITRSRKYTSYACKCVYINVLGAFPEFICISFQESD
jgi:hypothetical protein